MFIVPNDQIADFLRREVSGTNGGQDDDEADDEADAASETLSSLTMSVVEDDQVPQADADILGMWPLTLTRVVLMLNYQHRSHLLNAVVQLRLQVTGRTWLQASRGGLGIGSYERHM